MTTAILDEKMVNKIYIWFNCKKSKIYLRKSVELFSAQMYLWNQVEEGCKQTYWQVGSQVQKNSGKFTGFKQTNFRIC